MKRLFNCFFVSIRCWVVIVFEGGFSNVRFVKKVIANFIMEGAFSRERILFGISFFVISMVLNVEVGVYRFFCCGCRFG